MSDPAVEAAARAWAKDGHAVGRETRVPITAACEALAPIRELHRRVLSTHAEGTYMCVHCEEDWPCQTALYAYTSKELADG